MASLASPANAPAAPRALPTSLLWHIPVHPSFSDDLSVPNNFPVSAGCGLIGPERPGAGAVHAQSLQEYHNSALQSHTESSHGASENAQLPAQVRSRVFWPANSGGVPCTMFSSSSSSSSSSDTESESDSGTKAKTSSAVVTDLSAKHGAVKERNTSSTNTDVNDATAATQSGNRLSDGDGDSDRDSDRDRDYDNVATTRVAGRIPSARGLTSKATRPPWRAPAAPARLDWRFVPRNSSQSQNSSNSQSSKCAQSQLQSRSPSQSRRPPPPSSRALPPYVSDVAWAPDASCVLTVTAADHCVSAAGAYIDGESVAACSGRSGAVWAVAEAEAEMSDDDEADEKMRSTKTRVFSANGTATTTTATTTTTRSADCDAARSRFRGGPHPLAHSPFCVRVYNTPGFALGDANGTNPAAASSDSVASAATATASASSTSVARAAPASASASLSLTLRFPARVSAAAFHPLMSSQSPHWGCLLATATAAAAAPVTLWDAFTATPRATYVLLPSKLTHLFVDIRYRQISCTR